MDTKSFNAMRSAIIGYFSAVLLVVLGLSVPSVATANTVSVPFNEGFVGTVGANTQQADSIKTFATLGISRILFSQNSRSSSFEIQGNDIPGTLRLFQGSQYIDIPGAIVWRWPNKSPYSLGFIPSAGVNTTISNGSISVTITGGGAKGTSNLGIKVNNSSFTLTDGDNISGNAANLSSVLESLNTYLALADLSAPAGPITVTPLTTNDTTPVISGTATLASGETLSVTVDGVIYTVLNGLAVVGSTWSLPLPSLTDHIYEVEAIITNPDGYTLVDSSAFELTIDTAAPTLTVSSPADNVSDVAVDSEITLTFSENIAAGTGNITIYDNDDNIIQSFSVATSDVTFYGNTITLNPNPVLSNSTIYYIQVDATAVEDTAGNSYIGISDATALNFQTSSTSISAMASTITASPTSITADGTTTSTITVQLKDTNGNNLTTGGATVGLSTTLGTLGSVTDNSDGTYSAILTSSTTTGEATISGTLAETGINDTAKVEMTDGTAPTITGPDGAGGSTTGATAAITVDENQTAVATLAASETVTWSLSGGADKTLFSIDQNTGVIAFSAAPDYEVATDNDTNNDYVVEITATDTAGNLTTQTLTVTVADVWDSLPGTVNSVGGGTGDVDGDGLADSLESMDADRDADGVPDAQDYDPQGYLYCEEDGRILSGGSISVARLGGATSSGQTSTYDSNGIWIVKDGSDGEYQWFVNAPGTYTMSVSYPSSVGVPSTSRATSGTLDLTSLLPSNPASIGSSEFGTTGVLANYRAGYSLTSPAANSTTAFYTTFVVEAGDPNVIGNNIPVAQCGVNELAVAKTTDGAEVNGATPSQGVLTVSQGRISTQPTTVAYSVTGTATSGTDFTALSGSVTIPVGDTSATVPVSILEDVLIEGDETIVVTLTGITSGDLTTQLSTTASQLTASMTITDDDFATVLISNDDLLATEGRADDATIRFSLAGQPAAPVTLTFAGDTQCTVSPSTLTFTGSDFATPQALSISAINDEDEEGTHSCNPTVTVTSSDTRFDSFALTLATVTIADDLVDQVRNPLTEVLQNDFEQTVATQSRQFSQISKGALARLQDDEDLRCGVVEALDVDGTAEAGINSVNTSGTFGEEIYDCATGVRQIINGSFAFINSDTINSQGMFTFSVQNEKKVSEEKLRGRFFGGYLSNSSLDGNVIGNIRGFGAHAGLYGAYSLKDGLFFDYYAAGGVGVHKYNLSFDTANTPINAEGEYRYGALYTGAALSGETIYESVTWRPRLGIDLSYAKASDASVSASQLGLTDMGRIKLDAINGARFFAETIWIFGDTGDHEDGSDKLNRQSSFEVAPRVYCEKGIGQNARDCGYGGYVSLSTRDVSKGTDFAVKVDYETNNDRSERIGFEFSYTKDIFDGAGLMATTLGSDHLGNGTLAQSVSLEF